MGGGAAHGAASPSLPSPSGAAGHHGTGHGTGHHAWRSVGSADSRYLLETTFDYSRSRGSSAMPPPPASCRPTGGGARANSRGGCGACRGDGGDGGDRQLAMLDDDAGAAPSRPHSSVGSFLALLNPFASQVSLQSGCHLAEIAT